MSALGMANQTLDANRGFLSKDCMSDISQIPLSVFVVDVVVIAVISLICVPTSIFNALVILAIWRNPSLQTPANLLLACLALSDVFVGVICDSSYLAYKSAEIRGDPLTLCISLKVAVFLGWIGTGASFINLTAISLERCISLTWPLRSNSIFTTERVVKAAMGFWIAPILIQTSQFYIPYTAFRLVKFTFSVLCGVITTASCIKVYQVIRHHQNQVHNEAELYAHFHGGQPVRVLRQRRSVVTMAYIYGLYVICYSPCLYAAIVHEFDRGSVIPWTVAAMMSFVNSALNPWVLCWRIRDIRQAIWNILKNIKQFFCTSS